MNIGYAVMHQLVQNFITWIAVVGVNNDVRVGFLIVYPGAEVHEFIALFLECGQVKNEMRLIEIRLEVAFKENCKRPVLAYHLAGNGVQLGAYSAKDSDVFFSGNE